MRELSELKERRGVGVVLTRWGWRRCGLWFWRVVTLPSVVVMVGRSIERGRSEWRFVWG